MNLAHRLAAGMSWIDLQFLGRPKRIAAGLLQGTAGAAIVDPGPTSCLPTLERALAGGGRAPATVTHLLLTHIHLDHAGAAGTIARRHPGIRVVVHRQGAPHLADPAKLLESATRLYGADMDRLWGACEPVPEPQLHIVDGGEALDVAGRAVSVTYTPGHAKHHVSYFDRDERRGLGGRCRGRLHRRRLRAAAHTAARRRSPGWRQSIDRLEEMQADTLFLTHCGPVTTPRVHLRRLPTTWR